MARVLVVDEALMMRKTIGAFLLKAGHVVVGEAANGVQAVLAYNLHRPDIVTMDITLRGMDGIKALDKIINTDASANIIVVSALRKKHKVFETLQHGAKAYVFKPFTEEKLLSVVDEVLGATAAEQRKARSAANVMDKPLPARTYHSLGNKAAEKWGAYISNKAGGN
ncbi:MAG TPA: response regulator [Methylomusa anaerophila]|uniref:Chemotaxis protein CheY n=1 Tax=Methylomusa anaerophila TaxID=1930071 RepID=A0A348AEH4_9FIRM|nr:response regulator [Methylomusa anaerophila]BBB89472.1 chemotaxis protein CheY [Methylomusa anaerophila]HML89704.1 response regulator [Methylomusa anaerophila]